MNAFFYRCSPEVQLLIFNHSKDLPFYQFENLSGISGIFHGVYTRLGGVSRAPYDRLNVAFGVGDDGGDVAQNRALIKKDAGVEQLFFLQQIHDRQAFILSRRKRHDILNLTTPPRADAVISDCRHIGLVIQLADCQPVMLYDPVKQVSANIHSGWRGSIQNVIGHTVSRMTDIFGCDPLDIFAGIGPSLGPCCAEFANYQTEIPRAYWRYRADNNHFDFWAVSRDQLLDAGLAAGNVETGGICTKCRTDRFYSYRGEGQTGRFAAVIALA